MLCCLTGVLCGGWAAWGTERVAGGVQRRFRMAMTNVLPPCDGLPREMLEMVSFRGLCCTLLSSSKCKYLAMPYGPLYADNNTILLHCCAVLIVL